MVVMKNLLSYSKSLFVECQGLYKIFLELPGNVSEVEVAITDLDVLSLNALTHFVGIDYFFEVKFGFFIIFFTIIN
jgi:hypothetical protein